MLNELTLVEARDALQAGRISSVELVTAYLERIKRRESDVRAWAHIDEEGALRTAAARDLNREGRKGPLYGVPVGIKDVIDTDGMPTEYGSAIYAEHRPVWDAYCVAAIKNAGGIILGKNTTSEFAYVRPASTANPHNLKHTPGGSSSGSAAAVADFMVPAAISTQTGGSTVRPAAYCGIVGYKPSFGLINRAGLKPLAESLDTIGIMGRSVADVAVMLEVLVGDKSHVTHAQRPPVIGICRTPYWDDVEKDYQEQIVEVIDLLHRHGAHIKDVSLSGTLLNQYDDQRQIMNFEGARALAHELANYPADMSEGIRHQLERGLQTPREDYCAALQRARVARSQLDTLMDGTDFLITPSADGQAPRGLTAAGNSLFNRNWSLLGVPCITVPVGTSPDGLPYGVQLVGERGGDAALLAWATWVECAIAHSSARKIQPPPK